MIKWILFLIVHQRRIKPRLFIKREGVPILKWGVWSNHQTMCDDAMHAWTNLCESMSQNNEQQQERSRGCENNSNQPTPWDEPLYAQTRGCENMSQNNEQQQERSQGCKNKGNQPPPWDEPLYAHLADNVRKCVCRLHPSNDRHFCLSPTCWKCRHDTSATFCYVCQFFGCRRLVGETCCRHTESIQTSGLIELIEVEWIRCLNELWAL